MNRVNVISVMLVDDHAVVRAGYKFLLENVDNIAVIAEASNGKEAVSQFLQHSPDIVVMDLSMPGVGGLEAIRRIKSKNSDAKILVFTMHENITYVERALQAGVSGYISKNSSPEVLVTAIRKIASGNMYIDAEIAQSMVIQQTRDQGSHFSGLSSREFQVLCMFAEAQTLEEIGSNLSLSTKTIANYLTQIKDKLQVSSTAPC